jgi:HEAT repeat protein
VTVLTLIWLIACVLVVGAVAWMSTLIGLRLLHQRRAAALLADRRKVEAALIAAMQGRTDLEAAFEPFRNRASLLAHALLDFLGLVRGEDRRMVVAVLEELGVERTLRARVRRGSLAGRLACVEALGAFPGPETQFTLIRAASRGPVEVRLAALRSLWQAGGEVSVAQLVAEVESGGLPPSGHFSDLLKLIVEADPAAAVARLEQGGLAPLTRILLLSALGSAGAYGALPILMAGAEAVEPEVRTAAVEALGKLMHPAAGPTLRHALEDPAWQVRSAAAGAVGAAGLVALAEPLAACLADPVWWVRHQAAAALGRLGPVGAAQLEATAGSPHDIARRAAALVLAEVA